jgi:uncharacterized protein involved in exopolysaccharide biosynthesis
MEDENGGVEVREITAALRRGRRWIAGGALLGLLAGAAVAFGVTPRYQARTSVLIRSEIAGATSTLSKLSGLLGEMGGGLAGSALETEVAILQSRTVLGDVADSLGLQLQVLEPAEREPLSLFSSIRVSRAATEREYRFRRAADGFEVTGDGYRASVAPGAALRLPDAALVLRAEGLPDDFRVALANRESTIDRMEKALKVTTDLGDVVEVKFRSTAPMVSAGVLNRMVETYLRRRTTTDRGLNQYRYEFLAEHVDSIGKQLARAENAMREQQESSGVLDPEVQGESELTRAMEVEADLDAVAVQARALEQIVERGRRTGEVSARELASYPSLLNTPAISSLLSRLLEMETNRTQLLGRLQEHDPEVQTLDRTIAQADSQLIVVVQDYLSGLHRQEEGLRRDLANYQARLGVLPAQSEVAYRRKREVTRLSETLIALQSQLVQARLDAITEGGDVRQIDVAIAPRSPVFPNRPLSLFGGLLGGLFFGVIAAVAAGRRQTSLTEAWEVEMATGLPTVEFDPRLPLGYGEAGTGTTLLVVPVGGGDSAGRVGEQIARTAALQGENVVLADLATSGPLENTTRELAPVAGAGRDGEDGAKREPVFSVQDGYAHYPVAGGNGTATPRAILETLEERYSPVIAVLPGMATPTSVGALRPGRSVILSAVAGRVSRQELAATVALCRQMDVPPVGIVLLPAERRRR